MFTKFIPLFFTLICSFSALASPSIESWTEKGAKVLFVHSPELPMVDISVVFNAGSARDGDLAGVARLTNAMLDEGTQQFNADEIATRFANVGAEYSASSERDMAAVNLRSLTEPKALSVALETFSHVLTQPKFPESSFQRIQQQALTGLEAEKQSPQAVAERLFYKKLYGDHPYGDMPSGVTESVSKITVADLKQFFSKYYVSNNATIVLVGDIERKKAEQIIADLTAGMSLGEKAPQVSSVPPLSAKEKVFIDHPSTQTTILMGQIGMSRHDPDYFPLYVGNHILGGSGLVSQLSDEVREKRGLTYSVYSYFRPMQQQGPYQFGLQTRNEQADEALVVMQETLQRFIEKGPSEEELLAAKQNITGGFALRIDSNSEIAGYLSMLGFYDLPLDYLDTFNDKVDAVTIADIKDAYQRRVSADKMLTVLVGGKKE